MTHETYNGNLGGLEGADFICQKTSENLNLSGTWKAYLSVNTGALSVVSANQNYCTTDLRPIIKNKTLVGAFTKDIYGYGLNGGYSSNTRYWPEVPREQISYWAGQNDSSCDQWTSSQLTTSTPSADPKNYGRISAISYGEMTWKWFTLQDGGAGASHCSKKLRIACYEQ